MMIKNDLDKVNKIVSIFSIIKNGNLGYCHLRPRCVEVLSYYLLLGYNDDAKDIIRTSLKISDVNLHQINSELTKSGYLLRDDKNFHNRNFSVELQKIKDYFLNDEVKSKMLVVQLIE